MIHARRLRRNLKRALLPFESALLWILGPLAALVYWLFLVAAPMGRAVAFILTRLR
jgi:hypothetical protein